MFSGRTVFPRQSNEFYVMKYEIIQIHKIFKNKIILNRNLQIYIHQENRAQ